MASSKPTAGRPGAWWTPGKEKKQQTSNSPHKLKKLSPFHAKIAEDAKNCLITGLDLTWDGNIVIADRNNSKVKLFDHNGKFVSSLTLPEKPNDVAVISASKFAVCMWFQQIGIVKMTDDDELVLTDTIRLDYNIWAITARDDNLIITCATEPRSVKLITLGGDVLWSVATTSDGSVLFDSPYFITSSPSSDDNRVVVSDEDRLTLTVLDGRTGTVEHVFDVEYGESRGVALDDYDNIYICYETGEISVRGRDADKKICIVDKTDGLKKPCCMEFNLKTNEILLTTSFNDPKTNIIDYVHRYKMDVSGF